MRILITGAAAGLARGIAGALAADGHAIAITSRPGGTDPGDVVREIEAAGTSLGAFPIDFLADETLVVKAMESIVADAGPFDALVHAVGPMKIARFERSTLADYHAMIDGNLRSAVIAAAAVLPSMRAKGFGRLIFFGLNGAHATHPARGLSLHAAAKAGLVAFARSLAIEEGRRGITVNVIEPGDVREKSLSREEAALRAAANPRGRAGSWEDVAGAVRFFIDPKNDFVNGAVLGVNGGLSEPGEQNVPSP
ncbi:MAG: SDR family oxidoreductase [Candidatus Eremiobacteraeota bacterium]|nr:SDR family oxidoreductase [Candidatus Eremiobacteraeota bacterium]